MRLSDEQWLARARAQYQTLGDYEPEPPAPLAADEPQAQPVADLPACPRCDEHPKLEVFQRREVVSYEPLRYCPRCYGFWARRDALTPGVADPGTLHPALAAATAPPRCRLCFGRLKEDGSCRECGAPAEIIDCPSCSLPMTRVDQQGVTLDRCEACNGLWFDMGEIVRVYGPVQPRTLASSYIDPEGDDEEPVPPWQLAAEILLRLFLPFLPF